MIAKRSALPGTSRKLPDASHAIGRNVAIVSLLAIASRLIGLLREVIIARQFGTSGDYDAYLSAFRIPDLLFLLIMTGSFGSAFIPVFRGLLDRDEDAAWNLASAVITWTAIISVVTGIVVFIFANPIVEHLVAPGLSNDEQAVATKVMRILLLSPIFLGMGIAAKGILETHNRFTLPAIAPLLYNVGIIFGAVVLAPDRGVTGLAIGVIIGAVLHVAIQVGDLIKVGIKFRPTLAKVEGLRDVAIGLGPRIVGQAAFQLNFIVVTSLATREGPGTVSAISYAFTIMMLPNAMIGGAFATVLFPTMAAQFERGDIEGFKHSMMSGIKPLLFFALPASVGLYVFRVPIIHALLQSGAFSSDSTDLVAEPLAFFALALVFYSLVEILARTFYAMRNVIVPVGAGIFITVINITLGVILAPRLGFSALAMSLSISTAIEALILFAILTFKLGRFDVEFASWFARVGVATALMACVAFIFSDPLLATIDSANVGKVLAVVFLVWAVGICGGVYFAACYALRLPETERWIALGRRLGGRLPVISGLIR
ncbi:murein biosynthesis integral membrane protein MurJ [soil metagenome]